VVLCGWVHRRRDHGGVIFVDLRDRTGIAQVVFKPDAAPEAHVRAEEIRSEYVLAVRGRVDPRGPDAVNPRIPTGEVEVIVEEVRLLNTATAAPFAIEDDVDADEAVRLRHRIHDLRRPVMQRRLAVRHRLLQSTRAALSDLGLMEVETPVLARATPEGARDFLVPSRVHPGSFFALPQSPQILKQLLMIAGFEGYFQIARCFRDEDPRADRQPEFTQIDLEMAFVGMDDVLNVLEELTVRAFRDVIGVELPRPFPRLAYREAMARYGSDKPDTRIRLEVVDLTDIFGGSGFKVFARAVSGGGVVRGLPVPEAQSISRSELDRFVEMARSGTRSPNGRPPPPASFFFSLPTASRSRVRFSHASVPSSASGSAVRTAGNGIPSSWSTSRSSRSRTDRSSPCTCRSWLPSRMTWGFSIPIRSACGRPITTWS
jgi:aspartyl-tRNA synthetase